MEAIKNFFSNAILVFGMRRRSNKIGMLIILLVCVLSSSAIILVSMAPMYYFDSGYSTISESAIGIFAALAICNGLLVFFITCITASSEITGEKTRQTMDLLVCSQMSPSQIVWGKLLSSFSYNTLITVAMLPVYTMIFIFGGISASLIFAVFFIIFFFSFFIAALGVGFSAKCRKPASAFILTMLIVLAMTLGNGILTGISLLFDEFCEYYLNISTFFGDYETFPFIMCFNPIAFIACLIEGCYEGFGQMWSNVYSHYEEIIISLGFTPLFCSGLAALSIHSAINRVNPLKADKRK